MSENIHFNVVHSLVNDKLSIFVFIFFPLYLIKFKWTHEKEILKYCETRESNEEILIGLDSSKLIIIKLKENTIILEDLNDNYEKISFLDSISRLTQTCCCYNLKTPMNLSYLNEFDFIRIKKFEKIRFTTIMNKNYNKKININSQIGYIQKSIRIKKSYFLNIIEELCYHKKENNEKTFEIIFFISHLDILIDISKYIKQLIYRLMECEFCNIKSIINKQSI